MSAPVEQHPDPWQQNAIFAQLLQTPASKEALHTLEQQVKPIFNSHAFYSLDTGMLTVMLQTLTSLLTDANILPHLTPHDFKLGLHLAITPTLSQSASPSKQQPLHFDAFINAIAFCAYYYPPQKDPLHAPNPRLSGSPECLDVALANVRDLMVASANSPRTVIANFASPATTLAFATPRTTLPEPSPTETLANDTSDSPEPEKWFTPDQSTIRTKLFATGESNATPARHEDSVEAGSHHVISAAPAKTEIIIESDTKFKPRLGDTEADDGIDDTLQFSEKEQDVSSFTSKCTRLEEFRIPSVTEENILENIEISSSSIEPPKVQEEGQSQQEAHKDLQLQASECADKEDICKTPAAPSAAADMPPLDPFRLPIAVADEARDEAETTPQKTLTESENNPPDTAPTNLSLAPSSALSHIPSPDGSFASPELTGDPCTPNNDSSIEPMSSRKLSFSDSDDATDSSSCYENLSDNEDTMLRIESAFEDSHAVTDCDENDASSELLSPYSQLLSFNEEETIIFQNTSQDESRSAYNLADMRSQSQETKSETETASQTQAHEFIDSHSVSSERDTFHSEAALAPDALSTVNENEQAYGLKATDDIDLNEPQISLGLPAEAFAEAGIAVLHTPLAPATSTRFPDTDMEDVVEDEEEHTLLFEDGYESDGSELSMRTRETMSKMVEDYLSIHGSASPQGGPDDNCYAEDQILMTTDRSTQVEIRDEAAVENNAIVEDSPCMSEKAESKQSRINHALEHSFKEFGKGGDDDELGFKDEFKPPEREEAECALSPVLYSQKASFSSEITPDGLNFIKKQLVLPSPFVFTDSTVGSSMDSGPNFHENDNVKHSGEHETTEQRALMTVPVKEENKMGEGTVICHRHDGGAEARELEMIRVMRETLETCRVLREEIATKQQIRQERLQQQERYQGGFSRWVELVVFGLIIMFATLILAERRIQRGLFVDVLV